MKRTMTEIAKRELCNIEGFNQFIHVGIDELIEELHCDDEEIDLFQFEQNVLYYFNCDNEDKRKQIENAANEMFPYYKV